MLDHKNINNAKQGLDEIVKGICAISDADPLAVYDVLLACGAFKAFAIREDVREGVVKLIELINDLNKEQRELSTGRYNTLKMMYNRGIIVAYGRVLKALKTVDKSTRFRAPDKSPRAKWFLYIKSIAGGLKKLSGKLGEVVVK